MRSAASASRDARVLSVQSHTVHGVVGNKAAIFPMQLHGLEVDPVLTVHFSNHPGYGSFTGTTQSAAEFRDIVEGLRGNGLLAQYTHVLSGYARSADLLRDLASTVEEIQGLNPRARYFCDPVLGDNGKLYMPEENVAVYRDRLLPLAAVITPNQFEAEVLSGTDIVDEESAVAACDALHSLGPPTVVITSANLQRGRLATIASTTEGGTTRRYRVDLPVVEGHYVGCGDLFASLLLSKLHVADGNLPAALEQACASMKVVIRRTRDAASRELRLVQTRGALLEPEDAVRATRVCGTLQQFKGIVFDMDGTLTLPGHIDFKRMRQRLKLEDSEDILASVARRSGSALEEAMAIIEEEERKGWSLMELQPGLRTTLEALHDSRMRLAIATRNMAAAVDHFLETAQLATNGDAERGLFDPMLSREFGINKPDPRVALRACEDWGLEPSEVLFVGDHEDDLRCGRDAGCSTCLIQNSGNGHLADSGLADYTVESLEEILNIVGLCESSAAGNK